LDELACEVFLKIVSASQKTLNFIGKESLRRLQAINLSLNLIAKAIIDALTPSFYKNSAIRSVVAKQIYFTAWQILPQFSLVSGLLSYILVNIVISTTINYGLSEFALELIIRLLVFEIIPIMAVIFVAIRSGAAIGTEVALMKITNELEGLKQSGIDPIGFELVPRVIGGIISVLSITAISTCIALSIGFISIHGYEASALGGFGSILANVLTIENMIGLWAKVVAFGLIVTTVPIISGIRATKKLSFAPVAVLQGMVRLFFYIMTIEAISLAIHYI